MGVKGIWSIGESEVQIAMAVLVGVHRSGHDDLGDLWLENGPGK
jgi:hypothetical protein